ncbi:YchJ family metal-binding protein [Conexibacter sp. W3-3-2]|uniref:YchJ family protein n=1 Tax=Conexibacter sp. W3-3-2 TaxID=2675227 RepID=UPI0028169C26|nr:YchJ family metal-binding protein [Conexibacter sp. W3-3-2]
MPLLGAPRPPVGCPCGSGAPYADCCGPLHRGRRAGSPTAPTAERLMRSRYSAYVVEDVDYLLATWHPSTRPVRLVLDDGDAWLGLEVLAATEDTVRFVARHRDGALHEHSTFVREDGHWYYLSARS